MIIGSIIELYVGGTQIKPDSKVSSHLGFRLRGRGPGLSPYLAQGAL